MSDTTTTPTPEPAALDAETLVNIFDRAVRASQTSHFNVTSDRFHAREALEVVRDHVLAHARPAVMLDDAGVEALMRMYFAASADGSVKAGVRAVAAAAIEAAFAAVERAILNWSREESSKLKERSSASAFALAAARSARTQSMIAEARRTLRIPPAVDAPKVDVRAAIEADREQARRAMWTIAGETGTTWLDAAWGYVDGAPRDTPLGLTLDPNAPPLGLALNAAPTPIAPSVREQVARVIATGRKLHWPDMEPHVRACYYDDADAVLAHLAPRVVSEEAVEAVASIARRGYPKWSGHAQMLEADIRAGLAAVARVAFGEVAVRPAMDPAHRRAMIAISESGIECVTAGMEIDQAVGAMLADLRAAREEVERLTDADSEIRAAWKALGAQGSELLLESAERVIRERSEAKQEVETLRANIAEIRGAGSTLTDEDCAHVACLYWGGQPETHLPRNGMGSQAFNTARRASYDQRMRDVAVLQELAARFRSERPESGGAYEAGKLDGVNEALLDLVAGVVPSTPTGKNSHDAWHLTLAAKVRAEADRDKAMKERDEARAANESNIAGYQDAIRQRDQAWHDNRQAEIARDEARAERDAAKAMPDPIVEAFAALRDCGIGTNPSQTIAERIRVLARCAIESENGRLCALRSPRIPAEVRRWLDVSRRYFLATSQGAASDDLENEMGHAIDAAEAALSAEPTAAAGVETSGVPMNATTLYTWTKSDNDIERVMAWLVREVAALRGRAS